MLSLNWCNSTNNYFGQHIVLHIETNVPSKGSLRQTSTKQCQRVTWWARSSEAHGEYSSPKSPIKMSVAFKGPCRACTRHFSWMVLKWPPNITICQRDPKAEYMTNTCCLWRQSPYLRSSQKLMLCKWNLHKDHCSQADVWDEQSLLFLPL